MRRPRRSRGLSLVELLVAMTVLAIATTIALAIYDRAQRSFKAGENRTEQQQVVRIAYDMIAGDLRMAGFNTNPDGDQTRPDEQIEAAYDSAVVLRADFDATDSAAANDPEDTLAGAGSVFTSVSTGNDEIIAYVLAKPDGSSRDSMSFDADVGQAVRDGATETVTINGVALTQDDPPYTLYRMTLRNDPGACCGDGFIVRTPVADNVRSLRFRYYDHAGEELTPGGGADDATGLAMRRAVRRVSVDLEGLTRDPEPRWSDATDPDPSTRRYRKFRLAGDITPRNLGLAGIRDFQSDLQPPSRPVIPRVYPGHCRGLYVAWDPSPASDEVAYYRIVYGLEDSTLDGSISSNEPERFLGGLEQATLYFVAIEAVDAAGNHSERSPIATQATSNDTVPKAIGGLVATDDGNGNVSLTWGRVEENTAPTFGDPESPLLRDLAGYRVYRSTDPGFTAGPATLIADADSVPDLPQPGFEDGTVVNCQQYYYRVSAIDTCGVEGAVSDVVVASARSDVQPRAPLDVEAFHAGPDLVQLRWTGVREDVDQNSIYIDRYNIFRTGLLDETLTEPTGFTFLTQVDGTTEFLDSVMLPAGSTVWYRASAVDVCSPPNESDPSLSTRPECSFSGRVRFPTLAYGATVRGETPIEVEIAGATGAENYDKLTLTFEYETDGSRFVVVIQAEGPSWIYTWNARSGAAAPDFFQPGPYRVTATVEQRSSVDVCPSSASIRLIVDAD